MERGALGMVLLMSRVAGVAPFLRRAEYRVSLFLVIIAKLFILITAITFIVISASSSNLFQQKYESLIAFDILTMTSKLFVIIATLISVFNSPERIIRMLQFLKKLNQIDQNILGNVVQNANEIKLIVLILAYLLTCLVLRGRSMNTEKIHETTLNFLFLITNFMINLSAMQVSLFARRSMFSLRVINSSLKRLFEKCPIKDISSQIPKYRLNPPILAWEKVKLQSCNIRSKQGRLVKMKPEYIEEPVKLIRQCLKNYLCVCDIIKLSMDGDGLFIVFLLMLNLLNLLTHSYNLAICAVVTDLNFNKFHIFNEIFWCIIYSLSVIIFMEPFHKIQSEVSGGPILIPYLSKWALLTPLIDVHKRSMMQTLQFLLISLKWKNLDEVDMNNELHLFGRVININKPKYSPLGMFSLNRFLVVKVFGSLVTYLVIIVTYGPKLDKSNLITE